jgi:quinol monooxygenase YgiN
MYIVVVDFTILPARVGAFRAAMIDNARASREREPGCRQFDVCADPAEPARIFLYEVYDDRAAFDAHLASPHFRAFDAKVAPWIGAKVVRAFERIDP